MEDADPQPPTELPDLVRVPTPGRSLVVRVLLVLAALLLFVLAILGWIVPVITGIPFWILGFVMLSKASPRVARWVNRQEARLPRRWRLLLRPRLRRKLRDEDASRQAR